MKSVTHQFTIFSIFSSSTLAAQRTELNKFRSVIFSPAFLLSPSQKTVVLCRAPRRAYCNQCITQQSHPSVSSHLRAKVQCTRRSVTAAVLTGLKRLILVGLACKFQYSGFGGYSLQSPVSGCSLCEIEMLILLDEPSSGLIYCISQ